VDYKVLDGRCLKVGVKVELGAELESDLQNKIQDILLGSYTQVEQIK
jgi:hypothetical protein